ncbi:MAG: endonuclease/exonuclease/phosphatase family protein [Clostridia bacterium]|nr:endonuclease/exonuclease/phosphatase family protein [Clostridia bacterium]
MRVKVTVVILLLALTISICGVGIYLSFEPSDIQDVEEVDYSIKVMSFNVRTLSLDLNRHPNDDVPLRAPLIIKQIGEENPDLIGCQEWTAAHEYNIVKELGETYGYIVVSRDGSVIGEMGAIFYKKERFELIETSNFWLSDTPDEISKGWDGGCHRICTSVILKDLKSGKTIQFSNTHLDNAGAVARKNGTKMVIENMTKSQYPSILVGDFNYNNDNANYKYCIERVDDARLLAEGAITTATYNGWNKIFLQEGGKPIDHIMLSKDAFNVSSYKVLNKLEDDLFASDHFAVVAVVEVK